MVVVLLVLICVITLIPQGLLKKYKLTVTTVYDMRSIKPVLKDEKSVSALEDVISYNQEVVETLGKEVCEILDKYIA